MAVPVRADGPLVQEAKEVKIMLIQKSGFFILKFY
ncbi:MAG: hypothetical protein RLZZ399_1501 [Verrucomicrobiota bacterium]|jgi:hypothetical protein